MTRIKPSNTCVRIACGTRQLRRWSSIISVVYVVYAVCCMLYAVRFVRPLSRRRERQHHPTKIDFMPPAMCSIYTTTTVQRDQNRWDDDDCDGLLSIALAAAATAPVVIQFRFRRPRLRYDCICRARICLANIPSTHHPLSGTWCADARWWWW